MSPTSQHLIPKLRFPEFSGSWEEKKLGRIAKLTKGRGISKDDITEDGSIECIRYGELYTHYSEIIRSIKSKTNVDEDDLVLSKYNDIIIPASGETHIDIATASCVLKDGVALGGDLNIIRTNNNGIFFSYYLNSHKKIDIARVAQGISVVHLYHSQLQNLDLILPLQSEQTKIASFLSAVDEKIQQLTDLKSVRESYKTGMMQQIFSQQVRFRDENENDFPEWEEKKLGDIAMKQSSNISMSKIEGNVGNYLIYGASGIIQNIDFYEEENDYISIVKDGAGVGRLLYCKGKSSVLGTMEIIKPKIKIQTYFLYLILSQIDFEKYTTGSTIPHIYFKDYSKENIELPSLAEQEKIANFLSQIDTKISEYSDQIDQAKQWKKGLLQGLFI